MYKYLKILQFLYGSGLSYLAKLTVINCRTIFLEALRRIKCAQRVKEKTKEKTILRLSKSSNVTRIYILYMFAMNFELLNPLKLLKPTIDRSTCQLEKSPKAQAAKPKLSHLALPRTALYHILQCTGTDPKAPLTRQGFF